jgi:ubiquinone/menaquinone biosynthesis C-methylase UbiE
MSELEFKEYMKELIHKYDYYDPIQDRIEALKFAQIKKKNILDIGTGKGYIPILAAKKYGCLVTTIDTSKAKLSLAKEYAKQEKVIDKITFKSVNASKLPFRSRTFDAVICFNTLHHNKKNYQRIVSEMLRVSKSKVVITELTKSGARIFDQYIHPTENHTKKLIDLNCLESQLSVFGNVKKMERKLMTTFVCIKSK